MLLATLGPFVVRVMSANSYVAEKRHQSYPWESAERHSKPPLSPLLESSSEERLNENSACFPSLPAGMEMVCVEGDKGKIEHLGTYT